MLPTLSPIHLYLASNEYISLQEPRNYNASHLGCEIFMFMAYGILKIVTQSKAFVSCVTIQNESHLGIISLRLLLSRNWWIETDESISIYLQS